MFQASDFRSYSAFAARNTFAPGVTNIKILAPLPRARSDNVLAVAEVRCERPLLPYTRPKQTRGYRPIPVLQANSHEGLHRDGRAAPAEIRS